MSSETAGHLFGSKKGENRWNGRVGDRKDTKLFRVMPKSLISN